MDEKIGEGVKIPSPGKSQTNDPEYKVWKALNNTPGVGAYNLGSDM